MSCPKGTVAEGGGGVGTLTADCVSDFETDCRRRACPRSRHALIQLKENFFPLLGVNRTIFCVRTTSY